MVPMVQSDCCDVENSSTVTDIEAKRANIQVGKILENWPWEFFFLRKEKIRIRQDHMLETKSCLSRISQERF